MNYYYYIQTELVIECIDTNGSLSKTRTNRTLEKCYFNCFQNKDYDCETQKKKYDEELQNIIDRNKSNKIIHENKQWGKASYKKRYLRIIQVICPRMVELVKIYKEYTVWKHF
jgi:hypothetical protein